MLEPSVQNLLNAPEFSAPGILERSFELTDAAVEKGSEKAVEDDVQKDRDAHREIELFVRHCANVQ